MSSQGGGIDGHGPLPTMKVGETGYLKLADAKLDPEWRQGVVVDRSTDGALKIAVRITADEQHHCAAYFGFDAGKRHFILVAGGARQLVSACPEHHLALEMKASKLVEQASSFLQSCPADTSEEQVFATASEDLDNPKPTATRASVRTQQRPALDFEDGEDDESSSADSGSGEGRPCESVASGSKEASRFYYRQRTRNRCCNTGQGHEGTKPVPAAVDREQPQERRGPPGLEDCVANLPGGRGCRLRRPAALPPPSGSVEHV